MPEKKNKKNKKTEKKDTNVKVDVRVGGFSYLQYLISMLTSTLDS